MILNANIYGGDSTTIEPLSVTSNGTYTASSGTAYSPVTVNVSGGDSDIDKLAQGELNGVISGNASFIAKGVFARWPYIKEVSFPECITIQSDAFSGCSQLTTATFPKCEVIQLNAFSACTSLTSISFPMCRLIGQSAFYSCKLPYAEFPSCSRIITAAFSLCRYMSAISLPVCERIDANAFNACSSLAEISLPKISSIESYAFRSCVRLLSVYLNDVSAVPSLSGSVFISTPIDGYTALTSGVYGSVFVPASLYSSFLTAPRWSSMSARLVSV